MLDIGWSELLVIGVVALIVVGPKDLPGMFRALGKMTAKMRRLARDFQRAMDDAADESGVKQTAADLKSMTSAKNLGLDKLKDAADRFDKWQPPKPAQALGANTEKLKEERAAETQRLLDKARAEREAKAAAAAEAKAAAAEPRPAPKVGHAARPKNMPKKKSPRGRV